MRAGTGTNVPLGVALAWLLVSGAAACDGLGADRGPALRVWSPTPSGDPARISEGVCVAFAVRVLDRDGASVAYRAEGAPAEAALDPRTGRLVWCPTWRDAGLWDVTVVASDGGAEGRAMLALDVVARDRDGDELPDTWERAEGLDATRRDSDGDTIADRDEADTPGTAPDSDGDGLLDALDGDSDDDGLADGLEAGDAALETPPQDRDGDGLPDFRDPDSDDDGVPDAEEVAPRGAACFPGTSRVCSSRSGRSRREDSRWRPVGFRRSDGA